MHPGPAPRPAFQLPPEHAAKYDTDESDEKNRSRRERRWLRMIGTEACKMDWFGAKSVIEVVREITYLKGKHKGKICWEVTYYISSLDPTKTTASQMLEALRRYWMIEGGLHQRLDVTGQEDASRVRNRNALLLLAMARRGMHGLYLVWRSTRKNKRQSTLKDYYDTMSRLNQSAAFANARFAA